MREEVVAEVLKGAQVLRQVFLDASHEAVCMYVPCGAGQMAGPQVRTVCVCVVEGMRQGAFMYQLETLGTEGQGGARLLLICFGKCSGTSVLVHTLLRALLNKAHIVFCSQVLSGPVRPE
jgi:hypothetical protein